MALRIPLVRVEGKRYSICPHLTMTPVRFAAAAALERDARDPVAREAETSVGFEPSLYFFAGVAHPAFGDVVLAYHPEPSTQLAGGASTFDTGGMYLGHIKGRGLATMNERKAYVDGDRCSLDAWRVRASTWIEQHFDSVDAYLAPDGRPNCRDPDDRLGHPENERRAWAVEVRLYEDRGLFDDLAFVIVRQDFLQRALEVSRTTGSESQRLLQLIASKIVRTTELLANGPCAEAVTLIKSYVGTSGGALSW